MFALLGSSFGIWFNHLKKYGLIPSQTNMLPVTKFFKQMRVWVAFLFGPLSSKQKNVRKEVYSLCGGCGSSSFWFTNWITLDILGSLVPYIDILDLQLTVKDVLSANDPHTNILYTNLSHAASDHINHIHISFNDTVEDVVIWNNKKKMVLILRKVDTIGSSKLPIQLVKICIHTIGLGFGNFSFLKSTNSFFFCWPIIMLSELYLCWIIGTRADNEPNQLENNSILDLITDSLNLVHELNESNLSWKLSSLNKWVELELSIIRLV